MSKTTLVVGASPKPDRYAFKAVVKLREQGFPVIAFAPRNGECGGVQIQTEWDDSWDVHTVTLYINAKKQVEYMADIIALRPKRVIFNPGTENPDFEEELVRNGIEAIEACTLVLLATRSY